MFLAAADFRCQAAALQRLLDRLGDFFYLPLVADLDRLQPLGDGFIGFRLHVLEGEQLHLAHIFVHADAFGERSVDIHRLMRDSEPLFLALDEMQRSHIVEAVGQLDEQHADIIGHGEQEFAQIFRGPLVVGLRLDLRQLGHPVDQPGDFLAEQLGDFFRRGQRVLDRVVEQCGDNGLLVQLEIGHQAGDLDRMAEIGVAAGPFLAAMPLHGKHIGAVDQIFICIGIIGTDPFHQFILPEHGLKMVPFRGRGN